MEEILHVKDEEFDKEVLKAEKPVLVDFWASWCMPCKMQGEILKEWVQKNADKVKTVKINVDEEQKTAYVYKIESIPTLMVFKGGELKEKAVGVHTAEELDELVGKYI